MEENAVERGNEGAGKLLNASKTNSQVGVTRCGGTFTDPVAQICHLYDCTPFETRSAPVGPFVREEPAVTPVGVEPPFKCTRAAGRIMYCVGPRHGRQGNALRMASNRH